jgi:hypothetical protein
MLALAISVKDENEDHNEVQSEEPMRQVGLGRVLTSLSVIETVYDVVNWVSVLVTVEKDPLRRGYPSHRVYVGVAVCVTT